MAYIYLQPIALEEHMLYLREIGKKYGVYATTGKPHVMLLRQIIADYARRNGLEIPELYYPTGAGLIQVFPERIYEPAILEFREDQAVNKRLQKKYDKNYSYVLKKIAV